MSEPTFFRRDGPFTVAALAEKLGLPVPLRHGERTIRGVAPIADASADEITFIERGKYLHDLSTTQAGACFVAEALANRVPTGTAVLIASDPPRTFAAATALFFPDALRPRPVFEAVGIAPGAHVHPLARCEAGVIVEPGAVIGPRAEVGSGTVIAAGAVIGPGVHVGRNCDIGANAVVRHAILGDRVIVHPGAIIGKDGFGFAMGAKGHKKIPQVGRVVIQNDVEIGAGTAIDRGAMRDTVIGEGTKIDNQVQIGHNTTVGRHCILAGQVGISGSCVLEDFVVIGGGAGVADHVKIGRGARIGAQSGVMSEVPPGETWIGAPAQPLRDFFKSQAVLRRFTKARSGEPSA